MILVCLITADSDPKKTLKGERKGTKPLLDSLSTFFGTFGKKKGEKARKAVLAEMEEDADPDAQISGIFKRQGNPERIPIQMKR